MPSLPQEQERLARNAGCFFVASGNSGEGNIDRSGHCFSPKHFVTHRDEIGGHVDLLEIHLGENISIRPSNWSVVVLFR